MTAYVALTVYYLACFSTTDIDECALGNVCEQFCNNTLGSFFCSCESGYRATEGSIFCEGIIIKM